MILILVPLLKVEHLTPKLSYLYSLNRDYLNTSFLFYSGNFFL